MNGRDDVSRLLRESNDHMITLYLDVNPALADNQVATPTWRIWLRNALNEAENGLGKDRIAVWHELRGRVERFFESYRPQSRSLAVFMGMHLQRVYPLLVQLPNRIAFGPPVIAPLLCALDEYQHYVIALVDREEAHLVVDYLGRAAGDETERLRLDTHDWRRTTVRPATSHGSVKTGQGSSFRDDFNHRVDEHVHRFWREVSEHVRDTMQREHAGQLILAGNEEATHAVRKMLPEPLANAVTAVISAPPQSPNPDLLHRAQILAVDAGRRQQTGLVEDVIGLAKSGGRACLGKDAVLTALEEGRAEAIIAAWPPSDEALVESVAREATARGVRLELVHGDAAEKLCPYDGLAALLYYAPPSVS